MLDVGSSHYSKMLKVKGVINDNIEVSAEKQFAVSGCCLSKECLNFVSLCSFMFFTSLLYGNIACHGQNW